MTHTLTDERLDRLERCIIAEDTLPDVPGRYGVTRAEILSLVRRARHADALAEALEEARQWFCDDYCKPSMDEGGDHFDECKDMQARITAYRKGEEA